MELTLPLIYRLAFVFLMCVFARSIWRRDFEGAGRISALFVLVGITSTFHGIASGLGGGVGESASPEETLKVLLDGLAFSLSGSIVGFLLTLASELVLYLSDGKVSDDGLVPVRSQAVGVGARRANPAGLRPRREFPYGGPRRPVFGGAAFLGQTTGEDRR